MTESERSELRSFVRQHAPTVLAGVIASGEWNQTNSVHAAAELTERLFRVIRELYPD